MQTLTADALGIGLLVAGGYAEGANGRDTTASDTLFLAGGLTTLLATPIIHGVNGERGRAVGSFFMRWGLAGAGAMVAMAANSGCDDGMPPPEGQWFDDDFLCELDYVGYGVLGGFVAASLIDAAFMTDKRVERRPTWTPQVAANRDGARVGAAWTW